MWKYLSLTKNQVEVGYIAHISLIILQVLFQPTAAQLYKKPSEYHQQSLMKLIVQIIWDCLLIKKFIVESENVVAEMQVVCHSDAIVLKVKTNTPFSGMVYAKDSPNINSCVSEYSSSTNMTFRMPLKSCGTMFAEADDGIEYFNTVVVQPHMRLMTNQGKGYHIRCKYQTRERTIANTHFNVR